MSVGTHLATMSAMASEIAGISMTEDVFSSCSSPLSSPPSSPIIPALGQDENSQPSQESLASIAGPATVPAVSFSSRPKRQAAVRAAEKMTFIVDEFGIYDEQLNSRANKRSRDGSPEFEDSNTVTEESNFKRFRTRELSGTHPADGESKTDIDAEFDVDREFDLDNVSSHTADTDLEVPPPNPSQVHMEAASSQSATHSQGFLVTNILANLRAITTRQAQTAHQAHNAFQPHTTYQAHANQSMVNPAMVNQSMTDQSIINQSLYNPSWFYTPPPMFNLPEASPFVVGPSAVHPVAIEYLTAQAAITSIGLPDVNPAFIDHVTAQAPIVNNDPPVTIAAEKDETSAPIIRFAPRASPPIHSKFRGGICEALPYFKAYKCSCYNYDLVAKGFLIDHEVEKGDVFGGNIVISAVGGNRVREGTAMVRARDASDAAINVRALKNAYLGKSLIAIIAGENHPLYPCQPPAAYSVLDWFHITYMWKEKLRTRGSQQAFFTVWRVRFEKANLLMPSWWVPIGHEEDITPVTCPSKACVVCQQESKEIFTIGWFCLNHECANYYQISPGHDVDIDMLQYSHEFLNERTQFVGEIPSLMPEIPGANSDQYGTELHLRGGFVCPLCHHACRRTHWSWFKCESCHFQQPALMRPYPQAELNAEVEAFTRKMEARRLRNQANDPLTTVWNQTYAVRSSVMGLGGYTVRQFFLTDSAQKIIGSFTIFQSHEQINARAGGPDELFRTLEVDDIGLRRNPAAVPGHKLEGLTRHFQQNFGARYKFGVSVQSKGFADAPPTILKALKRLDWAKSAAVSSATANLPLHRYALGDDTLTDLAVHKQSFNELLALGYMEDDRINYHDDGEKELGPVVAALSLGSPSTMRFRPKRGRGFVTNGTRRAGGRSHHKDILEVEMKHGDMMVMAGTAIQRLYEHAVTPEGKRRFALTARFVDPTKMELQSDRDDALIKGAIPDHAAEFEYDGY